MAKITNMRRRRWHMPLENRLFEPVFRELAQASPEDRGRKLSEMQPTNQRLVVTALAQRGVI